MFSDSRNLSASDSVVTDILLKSSDLVPLRMDGWCQDRIFHSDGTVEVLEGHNLVVTSFLNLVQALLKGQSGYSGIQYWAVGSGNDSWDSSSPSPSASDTRLVNEIGRVAIDSANIVFLTSSYAVSSTPTNIIRITQKFGENDCNGKWREFGIFGGNASTTANSGIMVNHRIHGVITKTTDISVERVMRFTLNLA